MFKLNEVMSIDKARQLNAVTLAFVGDAVYSLWVRKKLVQTTDYKTGELQRLTARQVSAHGQSEYLERMLTELTEEEVDIFRRGRNAKKPTRSKNATIAEYNRSTGFEAVIGFLYLTGNIDRIDYLLSLNDN